MLISPSVNSVISCQKQALQAIEILKSEATQIQSVDFKKYADIIVNLHIGNKYYGLIKHFNNDMLDYCHKRFDKQSALSFIDSFFASKGFTPELPK